MAFGDKVKSATAETESLSVRTLIAEQIVALGPAVQESVIEEMVQRELTKRSDAIVQVMDQLSKLELDLRKIKPEQTFDGDGKVIQEYFTKSRLEEKTKLTARITRVYNALNKALEKGDFKDVYDIKNQKSGGDTGGATADTSDT